MDELCESLRNPGLANSPLQCDEQTVPHPVEHGRVAILTRMNESDRRLRQTCATVEQTRQVPGPTPSTTSRELRLGGKLWMPCPMLVAFAHLNINPGLRRNSLGSFKLVRGYSLSSLRDYESIN